MTKDIKQIRACLFDMDGLLINTEDIYTETQNELLSRYGKGPITWDVKIQLQGLPGPVAAAKVIKHYDLPLDLTQYETEAVEIQTARWGTSAFLPGAKELLHFLKEEQHLPIVLCTSSGKAKYESKTGHLRKDFDLFDAIITGCDSRIPKGKGKPSPDIYQLGLKVLNEKYHKDGKDLIKPQECLVFEDGVAGVLAGVSFGGYVIWCPHPEAADHLPTPESIMHEQGEKVDTLNHLDKSKFCFQH
ncbi:hypothetical protein ACO0QE_000125 [Hanseniaspora vineae]